MLLKIPPFVSSEIESGDLPASFFKLCLFTGYTAESRRDKYYEYVRSIMERMYLDELSAIYLRKEVEGTNAILNITICSMGLLHNSIFSDFPLSSTT